MGAKAGVITIDLKAGTAEFVRDLEKANGKLKEFGQHGVSNVQATSAALRVMEGNMGNNLRAAERFLAQTLNLGPILKAAFPVVGLIAFGGVLGEMIKKVYEFQKAMKEAPEKLAGAFRQLSNSLRTANDELRVSNDRLENEIAKLEGRRQNSLKLMLDDARLAADKLADSLDADLDKLNKVLTENEIGKIKAFFTGQATTEDLRKQLFGELGYGGFRAKVDETTDAGIEKINAAKTKDQVKAAQEELSQNIAALYDAPLQSIRDRIRDAEVKSGKGQAPSYQAYVHAPPGTYAPYGAQAGQSDETGNLEMSRKSLHALTQEKEHALQQAREAALKMRRDEDQIKVDNRNQDKPYTDRLHALDVQLGEIKAKSEAIGKPEWLQIILKSSADAAKVIEEVNKALEKQNKHLNEAQKSEITHKVTAIDQAEAEEQWKSKLEATTVSLNERIQGQQRLAAAIGKGHEATQAANVETELAVQLGEHLNDATWMQDHATEVAALRTRLFTLAQAEHTTQVKEAIEKIKDQIDIERASAAAQVLGAEAVRQATLNVRLAQMAEAGATKEQIAAERELYEVRRQNASAEETASITEQTDAIRRRTAAIFQGSAAVRDAELHNKLDAARRNGMLEGPSNEAAAIGAASQAEYESQVAESAHRASGEFKDQLDFIADQITYLDRLRQKQGDSLEIEFAIRNLEQDRLKIAVEQELQLRTAQAGMRAFFLEMQEQSKSTAQIVYDALNSALDRSSANLAKLATGQKSSFGRDFQQIGQSIVQDQIKGQLQHMLAVFGVHSGVPTGKAGDAKHVIVDNLAAGGSAGKLGGFGGIFGKKGKAGTGDGSDDNAPLSGDYAVPGEVGGFFGALLKGLGGASFGGARAGGGDVDPGSVFLVGEQGPELFRPPGRGTIVPNHALGGGGVHYTIDARGADLGAANRISRAIELAHNSAIKNSVRADMERKNRTPQRSKSSSNKH